MSYIPTNWQDGDIITASELNKMEQGIAAAGSGSDLPMVTAEDNGDVLTVVNGAWDKASPYDAILGLYYRNDADEYTLSVDAGSFAACEAKALAKIPVFIAVYLFFTMQSTHCIKWFYPNIAYDDYFPEGDPTVISMELSPALKLDWYSDGTYQVTVP